MKLQDWLNEKRWNTAIFSRESGVSLTILRKIVNGTGTINLDIALKIERETAGKVKTWDLSLNEEAIKKGVWPLPKTNPKKHTKKTEKKENDKNDIDVDNVA